MGTDNILEFLPEGEIPGKERGWNILIAINLIAIPLWGLLTQNHRDDSGSRWFFLAFFLLIADIQTVLYTKHSVKITLDALKDVLTFDYLDFWGREKSTEVYLKTAYFEYEADVSRKLNPMRLLTYNSYFKNKVVIRANKKVGFNREQLDTIAENIKEIRANLKGTAINQ